MIFTANKKLLIIFTASLVVYILSCIGLFDGLSNYVAKSLYNALGYTNKWSYSFGPAWFVVTKNNISALGSKEIVLIFTTFFYFYFAISRNKNEAKKFLFTVGFGIVLILITKLITSTLAEINFNTVLTETLSNFPSGHTFIATVLYLAIAQYLTARKKSNLDNKYFFSSASIVIILVGISRFIDGGHTVTEVIAGWSLGLCWFTFAQMFLKLYNKTLINK